MKRLKVKKVKIVVRQRWKKIKVTMNDGDGS